MILRLLGLNLFTFSALSLGHLICSHGFNHHSLYADSSQIISLHLIHFFWALDNYLIKCLLDIPILIFHRNANSPRLHLSFSTSVTSFSLYISLTKRVSVPKIINLTPKSNLFYSLNIFISIFSSQLPLPHLSPCWSPGKLCFFRTQMGSSFPSLKSLSDTPLPFTFLRTLLYYHDFIDTKLIHNTFWKN